MAKARMTMELPEGLNNRLEKIARDNGVSKTDIVKKALALFDVAHEAAQDGKRIGVFRKDKDGDSIEREIVGI
jgi:predicted transcriptional regulator